MLQGRAFQKSRTAPIETSAKGLLTSIMRGSLRPEALKDAAGALGRTATVRHVLDARRPGQLVAQNSPEIDNGHDPSVALERGGRQRLELGIGCRDQHHVRLAQAIACRIQNEGAPLE